MSDATFNFTVTEVRSYERSGLNDYPYNLPTITSLSPSEGSPGDEIELTIVGTHFDVPGPGGSEIVINLPEGWTVEDIVVVSPTEITVTVTIPEDAEEGDYDVSVTTQNGTSEVTEDSEFHLIAPIVTLCVVTKPVLNSGVQYNNNSWSTNGIDDAATTGHASNDQRDFSYGDNLKIRSAIQNSFRYQSPIIIAIYPNPAVMGSGPFLYGSSDTLAADRDLIQCRPRFNFVTGDYDDDIEANYVRFNTFQFITFPEFEDIVIGSTRQWCKVIFQFFSSDIPDGPPWEGGYSKGGTLGPAVFVSGDPTGTFAEGTFEFLGVGQSAQAIVPGAANGYWVAAHASNGHLELRSVYDNSVLFDYGEFITTYDEDIELVVEIEVTIGASTNTIRVWIDDEEQNPYSDSSVNRVSLLLEGMPMVVNSEVYPDAVIFTKNVCFGTGRPT